MTQGAGDGIGYGPEEIANSATASAGDGAAAAVSKAQRDWQIRTVSSNFVSADFRKMRTDSFQKSRTTRFRKIRVVR